MAAKSSAALEPQMGVSVSGLDLGLYSWLAQRATSVRLYIYLEALLAPTCSVVLVIVVGVRAAGEQFLELVELDFARAVLVDLGNQRHDVDRHFKFLLNRCNQLVCIDTATAVCLAAHGHERVQQVCVRGSTLVFTFFQDDFLELVERKEA